MKGSEARPKTTVPRSNRRKIRSLRCSDNMMGGGLKRLRPSVGWDPR